MKKSVIVLFILLSSFGIDFTNIENSNMVEVAVDYYFDHGLNSLRRKEMNVVVSNEIINAHISFIDLLISDSSLMQNYDSAKLKYQLDSLSTFGNKVVPIPLLLHREKSAKRDKLLVFKSLEFLNYYTVEIVQSDSLIFYESIDRTMPITTILLKKNIKNNRVCFEVKHSVTFDA